MANCKYCGKPVGLLRTEHKECAVISNNGWDIMINSAKETALKGINFADLKDNLSSVASKHYIETEKVRDALIQGFSLALDQLLDDGILTQEEEDKISQYMDWFSLSQEELDGFNNSKTKLVKAAVLRDLTEGKIISRIKVNSNLPFNFQKNEILIWLFANVGYFEQRVRTHFEGRSQGLSVKLAKGLYYRVGAFRGHPVKTNELVPAGSGLLGITNKYIYFSGSTKKFRVKYSQIMEFTPYEDGIGIQKDTTSARPQIFITGDGWFTYNLLTNLAKL